MNTPSEKPNVRQRIRHAGSKFMQACRSKRRKMGMGTLEVVIIIAALLTLALFFSSQIKGFASTIADKAFQSDAIIAELDADVG